MNGLPKAILLATDLSSRCDRALDRAVSLSEQWQSELVILHILEDLRNEDPDATVPSWRRPPDPATIARRQLIADIGRAAETADVIVEEGDPAETIVRTAEAKNCGLIVTGIARDELFGRFFLGTTVDRLLRRSSVPVLVVKNRARHQYNHIAVAIDFSETSRQALDLAARLFPNQAMTIFHAYSPPMSGLTTDPAAYRRQYEESVRQDYEDFLKSVKSGDAIRQRAQPFLEFGSPAEVLREGVRDMGIDLVVLGTQGRSALADVLIGSVAKDLMAELPCDALLVRETATEAKD